MIGILFKLLNDIYNELKILNNNELIKKQKEVIIVNKDYDINPNVKELIKIEDNDDNNYDNPIISPSPSPSQKNQSSYMIFRKKELLKLKDCDMSYSEKIKYIKEMWKKENNNI